MRITLIEGWKQAWRFHTVIVAALLGALNFVVAHPELFTPDFAAALAEVLPPDVMGAVNRWTPLALVLLRVIKQSNTAPAATAPAEPAPPMKP